MRYNPLKYFLAIIFICSSTLVFAQEQQDEKSPEERAYERAQYLEEMLKLEPHRTFFVDSILQHDMRALYDEYMGLRASGTQDYHVYQQVKDKWNAQIDSSFRKVLTEDQWYEYLKLTGKLPKEAKKKRSKKRQ